MEPGLVSVMMPAYNAEAYIGAAIESVLAQSYRRWELVIVDDGSTDSTSETVFKYADSRIRYIRQDNHGEASARNTALRNVQGEFLAFLDADDLFLAHHLESTAGYLSSHAQVDGVYTDGYYVDQAGNPLQTLSSRRRGPFQGNLFEQVIYSSNVFGPPVCVMLRTYLIRKHELRFDEDIIIGPDWDFFAQYADRANFGYIEQTTCLYRLHTNNISIRTALEKRAAEHAKCRINAIKMKDFQDCSVGTRTAVFYDLLANLLIGFPQQQLDITSWPEFTILPKLEQARLFRLMASKTMLYGKDQTCVPYWLERSRLLNPADWRAALLSLMLLVHPKLPRAFLKLRDSRAVDPRTIPPFADMRIGSHR